MDPHDRNEPIPRNELSAIQLENSVMPDVKFSASRAMAATGQRSVGRIRSKCANDGEQMVLDFGMNVGGGGGASMLFVVESAPV